MLQRIKEFFKDYKPFFVSFIISTLILGIMLSVSYLVLNLKSQEQTTHMQADDIPINNYYSPKLEDNLTLVFMACNQENENPSSYFLMHFNVIPNTCTVVELSKDTYTEYENMNKTLDEFYSYGGMEMVSSAICSMFSFDSNIYIKMTMEQIKNFCDYFSGFTFDINQDIQTDMYSFKKGTQSMDGLRIASLILDDKFNQKSDLISSFLDLQLNKELPKVLDNFYDFFYDNSITNLSRVTLSDLNKPIIRFFRNSEDKFIPYKIDTVLKNNLYYPNSDTINEIVQKIKSESIEPSA